MMFASCDEQLPAYNDPEQLLSGEMSGLYEIGVNPAAENNMAAFFTVTNIYDETLEDTVDIVGSIEIRSQRNPHIRRTIPISPDKLYAGVQYYDPATKILKLDPGRSITFAVTWDFVVDDRGVDPRGELFIFFGELVCEYRCYAMPEELVLTGEVILFVKQTPLRTTGTFTACYIYGDIFNENCPPISENILCADSSAYLYPCNPFGGNE
ncbi:MAG: hypothetical protein L0Y80_04890 [Ignavibacteriae bacterium]|nr:hypothetical protein [Ignavibacteriota bacterium]